MVSQDLRSSPFSFFSQIVNYSEHLLSTTVTVHQLPSHAHGYLLLCVCAEQSLDQQMSHKQTHKHSAVTSILLLRAIFQINEPQRPVQDLAHLPRRQVRLCIVRTPQRIIVKRNTIERRHEQERPVTAALCDAYVAIIVDG